VGLEVRFGGDAFTMHCAQLQGPNSVSIFDRILRALWHGQFQHIGNKNLDARRHVLQRLAAHDWTKANGNILLVPETPTTSL